MQTGYPSSTHLADPFLRRFFPPWHHRRVDNLPCSSLSSSLSWTGQMSVEQLSLSPPYKWYYDYIIQYDSIYRYMCIYIYMYVWIYSIRLFTMHLICQHHVLTLTLHLYLWHADIMPQAQLPTADLPGCWSAAFQPVCWSLSDAARPFGTSGPAGRPVTGRNQEGTVDRLCLERFMFIVNTPQHRQTYTYIAVLEME